MKEDKYVYIYMRRKVCNIVVEKKMKPETSHLFPILYISLCDNKQRDTHSFIHSRYASTISYKTWKTVAICVGDARSKKPAEPTTQFEG